jgi:hypothetical protein
LDRQLVEPLVALLPIFVQIQKVSKAMVPIKLSD